MNTGEKIDYMIQCLKVAKAEYDYTVDYVINQPTERSELWKFLDTHRAPNKALIKDNLRNVARIGNSVVPIMAQKLVEANCPYLKTGERMPNMSIDNTEEQLRFAQVKSMKIELKEIDKDTLKVRDVL